MGQNRSGGDVAEDLVANYPSSFLGFYRLAIAEIGFAKIMERMHAKDLQGNYLNAGEDENEFLRVTSMFRAALSHRLTRTGILALIATRIDRANLSWTWRNLSLLARHRLGRGHSRAIRRVLGDLGSQRDSRRLGFEQFPRLANVSISEQNSSNAARIYGDQFESHAW